MFGQELIIAELGTGGFILLFSLLLHVFESVCHKDFFFNEVGFLHCLRKRLMIYSYFKEAAN